ncbi:MAG: hypothetical protein AAGF46_00970, partial [Pseudomonadota bacterium]
QLLLAVPVYISICQGTQLPIGEQNETTVQIPSPFGGATVNAEVSYLLAAFDAQGERADIEYQLTMDPEGAKRLVIEMFDQIASASKPSQAEIAKFSIERNDSARCEVNAKTGLAESVRFTTENRVLDQFKSETFVIYASFITERAN